MRISWLLLITAFFFYSCKEDLTKLNAEELDHYIAEVETVLDSLKTLKSKLVFKEPSNDFPNYIADASILQLSAKDSSVIIKGKVESDSLYHTMRLVLKKPYQSDFNQKIEIASDGTFISEMQIEETAFYDLNYGSKSFELYLTPGTTIGIVIHVDGLRTVGDLENENNFLNSKGISFSNRVLGLDQLMNSGDPNKFDQLQQKGEDIIKEVDHVLDRSSEKLSDDFKDLYRSKIKYACAVKSLSIAKDPENQLADKQLDFDSLEINKEKYFVLQEFRKFVFNLFELKSSQLVDEQQMPMNSINYFDFKYNFASSLFSNPLIREFIKTDVVYTAIAKMNHAGVNPLVQKFKKEVSYDPFQYMVEKRYKSLVKPRKGTIAPELKGVTFEGNKFRLSEYRGKYVYIFSWATWCGPCKVEIPFYERMHEDYSDENIVFIGISVDKDKNKWRESFFYNEYPGIQVLIPGDWNSAFVKDYGVTSIPQFVLIDPNGVILETNAERPTKNIKAQLSQYGIYARQT